MFFVVHFYKNWESQWITTKITAVKYEIYRRQVIANSRYDDGDNTVFVGTVTRRTSENIMLIFSLRILLILPGESRNGHGTVTSLLCVNRPLVVLYWTSTHAHARFFQAICPKSTMLTLSCSSAKLKNIKR
jgi:hypothetical protein